MSITIAIGAAMRSVITHPNPMRAKIHSNSTTRNSANIDGSRSFGVLLDPGGFPMETLRRQQAVGFQNSRRFISLKNRSRSIS
jgi:hypothetical protein